MPEALAVCGLDFAKLKATGQDPCWAMFAAIEQAQLFAALLEFQKKIRAKD
ncbi:MAG: hypothetical protein HYW89_03215 [Candidatus Sungiibacteriota bacterium]|uniref:Uncharacterized protein n=1 Tax=Candidatus Sungiibacteriota bacterium TaxID=2750080 RepID=A0A7T5UPM0_9BACT|nr:MAG: hypothetical protein HYW89_03215 [Candidatus Sungbacteria bacterium]